jgi:hypothetical protein
MAPASEATVLRGRSLVWVVREAGGAGAGFLVVRPAVILGRALGRRLAR